MLMKLFDFIYHEKFYLDHTSTNIIKINRPYFIFLGITWKSQTIYYLKQLQTCDCRLVPKKN